MNKKIEYILAAVVVIAIIWTLAIQGESDVKEEKNLQNEKMYVITEIVPGEVVSIKPIQDKPNGDTFDESMKKIDAGVQEIAAKYRINYGETIIQFTSVYEKVLYVEPKTSGNCTIKINHADNITINSSDKP